MGSLRFVIIKLFLLLVIALVPLISKVYPVERTVLYLICTFLAVIYVITGIRELIVSDTLKEKENFRFSYLPFSLISKRIIRIAVYMMVSAVLFFPEVRLTWLEPLVFTMGVGEIFFFIISVKKKIFSIRFYKDYLYIMQNRELKIFAEEISQVDYRYENFYLILKNGETIKIDPEYAGEKNKEALIQVLLQWFGDNAVVLTADAIQKLGL